MFFKRFEALCIKGGSDVSNTLRALGLSTSKGTAWRNGSVPNGEILLNIASYFNVSTDYLLGNTDDPTPAGQKEKPPAQGGELTEAEDLLISLFRQVPQEQQAAMLQAIEMTLRSQGLL